MLLDFTEKLQKQIDNNHVQLVTISRPGAYEEYEPYSVMESVLSIIINQDSLDLAEHHGVVRSVF